jgi:streptogramin lyase
MHRAFGLVAAVLVVGCGGSSATRSGSGGAAGNANGGAQGVDASATGGIGVVGGAGGSVSVGGAGGKASGGGGGNAAAGSAGGKASGGAGGIGGAGGAGGAAGAAMAAIPVKAVKGINPLAMAIGSDGNIWFTEEAQAQVGRLTPDGTETFFPTTDWAQAITRGPDGNIWITEADIDPTTAYVAKMTTDGTVTEYELPAISGGRNPNSIITGPDGNMWWSDDQGYVGKDTLDGQTTQYAVGMSADFITVGKDGNLWFVNFRPGHTSAMLVSVDLQGTILTQVPFTCSAGGISSMALGPDGNFWLTEKIVTDTTTNAETAGYLARLTPSGVMTPFQLPVHTGATGEPLAIVSEPDGLLWFLDAVSPTLNPFLASITPTGTITEYPLKQTPSGYTLVLNAMAPGLDGKTLWFIGESWIGSYLPIDLGGGSPVDAGTRG